MMADVQVESMVGGTTFHRRMPLRSLISDYDFEGTHLYESQQPREHVVIPPHRNTPGHLSRSNHFESCQPSSFSSNIKAPPRGADSETLQQVATTSRLKMARRLAR